MDSSEADGSTGTLLIAAAPIGRPDDASPRLAAALSAAQIIAAEDTRRVRRLAAALGAQLTARIVSYYDFDDVETRRAAGLLADLRAGHDVLLVTDAGMPGVSDPGYRVVAAAAAEGIRVSVLPGPSAVTAALAVSGLPTDRFCFEGFPARKAGERARKFAELAAERRTLIFFESGRRLAGTLAGLAAAFGADRRAAVCRELTKTHEEIRRGTLAELADWAGPGRPGQHPLGEITLVVAGAPARPAAGGPAAADAVADVAARVRSGLRRNAAITAVARERGLDRGELYNEVARHRKAGRDSLPPGLQQPPGAQPSG
jgi:16S rRNA (cytidine1402-2'-O)-methyltransferase